MNRRDFAKGFAALPFIGSVKGFASICNSSCPSRPHSLWVALEGPFAVVVDSATYAVTAFTPRGHGDHFFALNGAVYDQSKTYDFTMAITPWNWPPSPLPPLCVKNDAPPFCAENTQFNPPNNDFISIKLPAPQRIIVHDSPFFKADMQDNTTKDVPLPLSHVLEYDLSAGNQLKMTVVYDNITADLQPISPAGGPDQLFRFEVGLPRLFGGGPDPNGSLATEFHNKFLLPNFPKLAMQSGNNIGQVHTLVDMTTKSHVTAGHQQKATKAKKGNAPSKKATKPNHSEQEHFFTTTTFECKSGGLLVTSP